MTDALTGVFNRCGLMAAVEKAQADAISTGRPLALAVVDIDHFKRFNDRFGHAMGDDVLRFVASHLADRLETDGGFVGRLGGEEFVGVMPATSVQAAAGRIAAASALVSAGRPVLSCTTLYVNSYVTSAGVLSEPHSGWRRGSS